MKKVKVLTLFAFLLISCSLFASGCSIEVHLDYNVRFYVDGVQVAEAGTNGKTISMPKNPTKEGYEFDGWYWDEGIWEEPFSLSSLMDKPLEENNDFIVYAKWKGASVRVTFNSNGGSSVNAENFTLDEPFGILPKPEKEGLVFLGWYTQSGEEVKASTVFDKSMVNLIARWGDKNVTVTFHTEGGSAVASKVYICDEYMGTLPKPAKKGYNFYGWFSESGVMVSEYTKFDYSLKDLYARWKPITFRANFYMTENSYSALEYTYVEYGGKYDLPATPEREHKTFKGWYIEGTEERITKDSVCGFNGDNNDVIRIVARWENIKYKLKFMVLDKVFAEVEQEYDSRIVFPDRIPVRTGYEFTGWDDENGNRIWEDDYYLGGNTAYADWRTLDYNVTYIGYGGVELRNKRVYFDSTYDLFTPPVLSGYEFEGWYTQPEGRGDKLNEYSKVSVADRHSIYAYYVLAEPSYSDGVYSVSARVEEAKFNKERESIVACEYFAPDGESYGGEYNIVVYGKTLIKKYVVWTGHFKPSFDTCGDILAIADGKEYVALFNVADGREIGNIAGESGNTYNRIAMSADTVAFANKNQIVFYNMVSKTRVVSECDIGNPLLAINRDANILYVSSCGYSPGSVAYYNMSTGERIYRSQHGDFESAYIPVWYDGTHVWYDEYNPVMLDAITAEILTPVDLGGYAEGEVNKRVCADNENYIVVESMILGETHDDETSVKNYRYYDKFTGNVIKTITVKVSSDFSMYGGALIIYSKSDLRVWYLP